jgi:hypothetical protein
MAAPIPTRPRSRRQPTGRHGAGQRALSAHLAGRIISVVTVTAPGRYAAVTVARAVVSEALNRQALSSSHPADDRAQHRSDPAA